MDLMHIISVVLLHIVSSAGAQTQTRTQTHVLNAHTCKPERDGDDVTLVCDYKGEGVYAPDRLITRRLTRLNTLFNVLNYRKPW